MRTALYPFHEKLGAKIVDFSGWEMPLQYQGIVSEHLAVRQHAGLFDVSHMGRITVEGPDAESLLDFLSTNEIAHKEIGTATYTVWCNASGGCVDDLIVYRETPSRFFVVVNAGNRQKDLSHLQEHAKGKNVRITPHYETDGILALQGPAAERIMAKIFPGASAIPSMHFASCSFEGEKVILSRTGYTGAGGYEIYASNRAIVALWERLLESGRKEQVVPLGLGARDTLRLEMGYALYGHELSAEIAAIETVSAWTVKWNKSDFLGKAALEKLRASGQMKHEYGILLNEGCGIAREGFSVFLDQQPIGLVTSGTFSPSLNRAIAIVLVERKLKEGDSVEIQIRHNRCQARVVPLPFYH